MRVVPALAAVANAQKVGAGIVITLLVVWAVFLLVHLRKAGPVPGSEIELAPNRRPYHEDEILEGPHLERVLFMALILLVVSAVGLPLYWLKEPGRQDHAKAGFSRRSVHRGGALFLPSDSPKHGAHFGCAVCHGGAGQGASASYTLKNFLGNANQVTWSAPALNTVALRYSKDTIRTVLVYGRANTPMPAWGVKGGGPMNDQQIDDLVNYLYAPPDQDGIALTSAEAQEQSATAEATARVKALGDVTSVEAKKYLKPDGEFNTGYYLFDTYCGRCHTKGWSYDKPELIGGGGYGPALTDGRMVRQFPNPADHIDFITIGAEYGKPFGSNGIGQGAPDRAAGIEDSGLAKAGGGMPYFGKMLSAEQITAIVEYERSL